MSYRVNGICALLMLSVWGVMAQTSVVRWSVLDSGFGKPANVSSRATAAVGQTFTGLTGSANTLIFSGFFADTLLRAVLTDVQGANNTLPERYELRQNYPNPFNPSTIIRFSIPAADRAHPVLLRLYDVLGREVRTLVNESLQPGRYQIMLDAAGLATGVYFYRLQAGDFVATKKLILLR